MIEIINERIFHLKNKKISYVISLLPNRQLSHVYFGKVLYQTSQEDFDYITENRSKSAGTAKYFEDNNFFTLQDQNQEVPIYGTSDFKIGMIEVYENDVPIYCDFKLHHFKMNQGKERNLSAPSSFASEDECESITFYLVDEEQALELQVTYSIFTDMGVISRGQKLINLSSHKRKVTRFLSGALELENEDFEFIHLSGAWLKERHIKKHLLEQGTVSVGSLKGASSHQHNPFVALKSSSSTLSHGTVYGANIVYSGNFIAQAEMDEWDRVRLMLGIHPNHFSWELDRNAYFETPEAIFTYTDQGLNGLIHESSQFVNKHIINPVWQNKPRPIVLNNWEATYFDFDHKQLLELAKEGKKLGMDCFVLDDGWFSNRDNDRSSLGDWFAHERKFPNGIEKFADDIHSLEMQVGIWFEPEMISPDSQLIKEHPDWVVRHLAKRVSIARGQYVLDFSNPEVVNNIYQQMKGIISKTKLDYIKWDMNRNITEAYSNYLHKQNIHQTEFFHRYILGVYSLYEKILTDFPDILIEGCAGGGGRYDLGILFYSPQIWPSDDSDAVERLSIQNGTLLGYPLSTFSNHVSEAPNHQVGRATSLKFRQDVSMFGPLGYELNLFNLSEEEKVEIQKHIAFYKEHQNLLVYGNFHQLIELTEYNNEIAWAVNDYSGKIIVAFFRKLAQPNPIAKSFLKLPFLDENKQYSVNGENISGSVLSRVGIRKPIQFNAVNEGDDQVKGDFQSFVYVIKEEE